MQDNRERLNELESAVLEDPAIKQRAKAIVEVSGFATRIGMDEELQAAIVDQVRDLDKKSARSLRRTLSKTNSWLQRLNIAAIGATDTDEIRVDIERPASIDSVSSVAKPEAVVVLSEPLEEEADEGNSLIELMLSEGGEQLSKQKVESFLHKLAKQGVVLRLPPEDITHRTLEDLSRLYAMYPNTDDKSVRVNSMCTWGFLAGVDMAELVLWRAANKPDASKPDVYNAISSYIRGVGKTWEVAHSKGERPELKFMKPHEEESCQFELPADLTEENLYELTPEPTTPEPITEQPTPTIKKLSPETRQLKAVVDSPASESSGESLENVPPHVQLASKYIDRLKLRVIRKSFEELLNPYARGYVTTNKQDVIDIIHDRIESLGYGVGLLDTLGMKSEGVAAVRLMLGIYTRGDRQVFGGPIPLADQISGMSKLNAESRIDAFYATFEALLDKIAPPSQAN